MFRLPPLIAIIILSTIVSAVILKILPLAFPYLRTSGLDNGAIIAVTIILVSTFYGAFKERRFLKFILHIFLWLFIILVIITTYSFKSDLKTVTSRVISSIMPSYGVNYAPGEILISRSMDGHFYVQVFINEIPIKFMIDTGASDIALTKQDARKLNFDLDKLKFTKIYSTANGLSTGAPVILRKMQIGARIFKDISASITSGENDISLLGMSLISLFKSFRIDGDTLFLSY